MYPNFAEALMKIAPSTFFSQTPSLCTVNPIPPELKVRIGRLASSPILLG